MGTKYQLKLIFDLKITLSDITEDTISFSVIYTMTYICFPYNNYNYNLTYFIVADF